MFFYDKEDKFNVLTLYHTILTFNDPEREGSGQHRGKGRKCW